MGFPTYDRYVESGEMTPQEASAHNAARDHGRISAQAIPVGDHPTETVMLGVLDAVTGSLVRAYGARSAAEIMRHYGEVCERNAGREPLA